MKQEKSMTKFSSLIVFMLILCGLPAIFLSNKGEFDFSLDTIVSSYNEDCNRIQLSESDISSHPDQYNFLEAWDTGPGQDVVIDESGNVYKTNQGSGVDIYDTNGNYITTWTGGEVFGGTCGLIFDSK